MTADNYNLAISHAQAARATVDHLERELEATKVDPHVVKALNARIGVGLKLAEVHATLAVVDALDRRRARVVNTPARPVDHT